MTKHLSRILTSFLLVMTLLLSAVPFASAATLLDESKKVSISLECDKPDYVFEVYRVASLDTNNTSPYETKYTSFSTIPVIAEAIKNGNTSSLIATLDGFSSMPEEFISCGVYDVNSDGNTKTFDNLEQGIYYVKATNFPAGVKRVTNSAAALPYYNNGWVYSIDPINLATKIVEDVPVTHKEITNSTKDNVNFTDVSLGDTVNFEIRSTTAGSASMRLGSYYVTDDMSAGLTLDKDSFNVSLLDKNGEKLSDLAKSDYNVNITSEAEGKNTEFNVALTKDYLQKRNFYNSNVYYTSVTYSAVLNKYAVVGIKGNPNTEGKLVYSNKNGVESSVDGNTVYVYTYAITSNKVDPDNKPLEGGEFAIYSTEENATKGQDQDVIATGVSDENGIVKYYNSNGEEMKFASGTYYVRETKAPKGYVIYGNVIKVEINAEYGNVLTDGTYVTKAPENGTAVFNCTNHRIVVPQTGGSGTILIYIIGGVLLAASAATFFAARYNRKKVNDEKDKA